MHFSIIKMIYLMKIIEKNKSMKIQQDTDKQKKLSVNYTTDTKNKKQHEKLTFLTEKSNNNHCNNNTILPKKRCNLPLLVPKSTKNSCEFLLINSNRKDFNNKKSLFSRKNKTIFAFLNEKINTKTPLSHETIDTKKPAKTNTILSYTKHKSKGNLIIKPDNAKELLFAEKDKKKHNKKDKILTVDHSLLDIVSKKDCVFAKEFESYSHKKTRSLNNRKHIYSLRNSIRTINIIFPKEEDKGIKISKITHNKYEEDKMITNKLNLNDVRTFTDFQNHLKENKEMFMTNSLINPKEKKCGNNGGIKTRYIPLMIDFKEIRKELESNKQRIINAERDIDNLMSKTRYTKYELENINHEYNN